MKKILIAIPSMDTVPVGFCQSLATLNKVGECVVSFNVGSLIYEARNKLATQAVKGAFDYVIWFDSDMIFAPDTMERLIEDLENGCDIVSGLYFRRVAPYTPVLFKYINPDSVLNAWGDYNDYPRGEIFEVGAIGFGCVAMKTEVLLSMAGKFNDWFTPIKRFGEDIAFSIRAKECGYKIFCDSRIKLGHVARSIITEEFYDAFKGAEA